MQGQEAYVKGFQHVSLDMALAGIFLTIEEYVKLWVLIFYKKQNSPCTLNRKCWISMSMPYLTSQQLS
jgi:hypothetical protein